MMMKGKFRFIVAFGIIVLALPMNAQTDPLTKPGGTFQDPKATIDNSKVLIDTSSNVVDSLLDQAKTNRINHKQNNFPMRESEKPAKKKSPSDSIRRIHH